MLNSSKNSVNYLIFYLSFILYIQGEKILYFKIIKPREGITVSSNSNSRRGPITNCLVACARWFLILLVARFLSKIHL